MVVLSVMVALAYRNLRAKARDFLLLDSVRASLRKAYEDPEAVPRIPTAPPASNATA